MSSTYWEIGYFNNFTNPEANIGLNIVFASPCPILKFESVNDCLTRLMVIYLEKKISLYQTLKILQRRFCCKYIYFISFYEFTNIYFILPKILTHSNTSLFLYQFQLVNYLKYFSYSTSKSIMKWVQIRKCCLCIFYRRTEIKFSISFCLLFLLLILHIL